MAGARHCHACPDCGTGELRRHRTEEKQPKFIQYEYRCSSCGARFTGAETIEARRAFGDAEQHDDSIPLAPKLKRMIEKRFLTTQ